MGEFNEAVIALLEAFSGGLAVIKTLKHRRKEGKAKIDAATQAEELRLRRSLKKNREDVRSVYSRDLEKLGTKFAEGDVKSRSSLASILFRLNSGLVSIIDRFTRGKSTRTDYATLVKLSNASRIEAINTFGQLSARLSQSSLSQTSSKQKRKQSKTVKDTKPTNASSSSTALVVRPSHIRSKSAPNLSQRGSKVESTGTGEHGRPKTKRKSSTTSTKSRSSGDTTPKPSTKSTSKRESNNKDDARRISKEAPPNQETVVTYAQNPISFSQPLDQVWLPTRRTTHRQSMMSFASDSTKIGEIPEHRWGPTALVTAGEANHMAGTAYPLSPWREPEKPRSRFMRFFRG